MMIDGVNIDIDEITKKALFIPGGNEKLGPTIGTWSVLYGDEPVYIPAFDCSICGTCGLFCKGCKPYCYVGKSYRWDTVKQGHAIRTLAIRYNLNGLEVVLDKQLTNKREPFPAIRLNQSGEIENIKQLEMFVRNAAKHPETIFFIYTKAYDIVIPYLLNNPLPDNFVVLISVWNECGIEEYKQVRHLKNVKAFVTITGFDYAAHDIIIQTTCKAYDGGKLNKDITCEHCKKCFVVNPAIKVIGCLEHE